MVMHGSSTTCAVFGSTLKRACIECCLLQDCTAEGEPQAYIGCFRGDVRQGLGVASYKNGEEFAGEFQAGAAQGYGVAELGAKGGLYEGEWRDGSRHGWAVSTLSNRSMWAGTSLPLAGICV